MLTNSWNVNLIFLRQDVKPEKILMPDGKVVEDYWKASLKILSDVKFMDSLLYFDKDNIPERIMEKIRKDYLTNPNFDPDKIKTSSTACQGLCKWIYAISEYDKVAKVIAPKKKALAEAQATYNEAMVKLEAKRAQLAEVQVRDESKKLFFIVGLEKSNCLVTNPIILNFPSTRPGWLHWRLIYLPKKPSIKR